MRQLSCLVIISFICCLVACSQSDESTSTKSKPEPPPKTATEKIVGKWEAIVSFSNEKFDTARDALADDDARNRLDAQVEKLMGSMMHFEFKADGVVKANMPVRGKEQKLNGKWTLTNDKNDSAMVTMLFQSPDGELKREATIAFKDDDNFTAPFDPPNLRDPSTKGIFYLDVVRNRSSN